MVTAAFFVLAVPDVRAADRPNFVVIQTDDQALRLMTGSYRNKLGQTVPVMPRLNALFGKRGTQFQNAYAPTPICGPSRAALLTGMLPHNNEVVTNFGPFGGWQGWRNSNRTDPNLATSLDAAGYRTAHFGKFFNNYGEDPETAPAVVPPGWDVWGSDVRTNPIRHYYDYTQFVRNERDGAGGVFDQLVGPFGSGTFDGRVGIDPSWCEVFTKSVLCNYHADRLSQLAAAEVRASDDPFFVLVNHHGPHGDEASPAGPQPATRHLGLAARASLPKPPSFNERNTSDKDFLMQRSNGPLTPRKTNAIRTIWRKSIESLQSVDEGIGLIHAALRETGKLDNTYFIFTSDNGFFHGEHRFTWGKGLPYEESARVPLVVAGPGVGVGETVSKPVSLVDIAPTVLDLAGLEAEGMTFDGRSLKPHLEGRTSPMRAVIVEAVSPRLLAGDPTYPPKVPVTRLNPSRPPGKFPYWPYRALRIGPYKYTDFDSGGEELYDLRKDPGELYNQADSPGYRDVLRYMRSMSSRYRDCIGDECLVPPRTTPKAGAFLIDARQPPRVIEKNRAFHFGQKLFASVSCPAESDGTCTVEAEARRSGRILTRPVEVTVRPGDRERVGMPILPSRQVEVIRLSEPGEKTIGIRTEVRVPDGRPDTSIRLVRLLQR